MAETGLAAALAAFQLELPNLGKANTADTGSYKYKYADLADVSKLVLPLLAKHGLSFSAKPTLDDQGRFVLAYVLRHTSGESDAGSYPLPNGSPQQIGSAITYARRYALSAVTGIAPDEDDDGKAAKTTQTAAELFDPIEQEEYVASWTGEIAAAKSTDELNEIWKTLSKAKRNRTLSPPSFDHLVQLCARRKAELNGAT